MTTQRAEIILAMAGSGWKVMGIERSPHESWADELIALESAAQQRVYLTFLVDPMHEGPRRKGEAVWAVVVSRDKPVDRAAAEANPLLAFGPGWRERLAGFIARANSLP